MAAQLTFLSDFGDADGYAGACRAVISRIAPDLRVVDLAHDVPPADVRRGALALADAVVHSAPGSVHLAVVDPGVGTERRGVAIQTVRSDLLVGPDNGLLVPAAARLGAIERAVDLAESPFRAEVVAPTFHGRDVFAPAAARLADGAALEDAGPEIDPAGLAALTLPRPAVHEGRIEAHVLYVDRFGNLILDAEAADLEAAGLAAAERVDLVTGGIPRIATRSVSFAEVDHATIALYDDSSGRLGIAVNGGSAAERLGIGRDGEVELDAGRR